jgi:hypothetical protein
MNSRQLAKAWGRGQILLLLPALTLLAVFFLALAGLISG